MLFHIFTNELEHLPLQSKEFHLVLPHEKYDEAIPVFRKDIDIITRWFAANFIFVNAAKTKLLWLQHLHKKIVMSPDIFLHSAKCLNCGCKPLNFDSLVKCLGVSVDEYVL